MEETWEVVSAVVGREGNALWKVDLLARMVVVVAGKKRTKVEGKMRTGTGGAGEMSFLVGQWLDQTACYLLAFIIV